MAMLGTLIGIGSALTILGLATCLFARSPAVFVFLEKRTPSPHTRSLTVTSMGFIAQCLLGAGAGWLGHGLVKAFIPTDPPFSLAFAWVIIAHFLILGTLSLIAMIRAMDKLWAKSWEEEEEEDYYFIGRNRDRPLRPSECSYVFRLHTLTIALFAILALSTLALPIVVVH